MPKKDLFFIAILPPQPYRYEIDELKREAAEKFGSKAALKSPPHLTLHMPFQWRSDKFEVLKNVLEQFGHQKELEISIRDFNFFEPRVVYLHVEENEELREFQKKLVRHIRVNLNILNADYKDRGFHPHITIAFRDLKKSLFPAIKASYSTKHFRQTFNSNKICLLKHDGKQWNEYLYF